MPVYQETFTLPSAKIGPQNQLPYFRASVDNISPRTDSTLLEQETVRFGENCGRRVLPYLMQDGYTRVKQEQKLTGVVLENETLKATLLPALGGRLYSLYHKKLGRELLFKNPVLQPANLAIRNAWFAGGIEWNLGRVGHTFFTCESVFCAKMCDEQGNDFVRIYEFERQTRLFWQVDFHLPKGAQALVAYVRVVNDDSSSKPLYWWTNIALPLDKSTRVFSGTSEIFYMRPEGFLDSQPIYGHGRLPKIAGVPGMCERDITYPLNIKFSSEYFFQNPKTAAAPWEGAAYGDGLLFFERSTQPLCTRKMFTWGDCAGGRHWCDYLALPGEGDYVEIQAGVAPSQLHTALIEGESTVSFVQAFGGRMLSEQADYTGEDYDSACLRIEREIDGCISPEQVTEWKAKYESYAEIQPHELLSYGSGFGALEGARRKREAGQALPEGLLFPQDSITSEQALWQTFLDTGRFPALPVDRAPESYMTDTAWADYFLAAAKAQPENAMLWYHYGVLLAENDEIQRAIEAFEHSLAASRSPWALYALGAMQERAGQRDSWLSNLGEAYENGKDLSPAFGEALILALMSAERFDEAFTLCQSETREKNRTQRFLLAGAAAGLKQNDFSLAEQVLAMDIAIIREGENNLSGLWAEYTARKYAKEQGLPYAGQLPAELGCTEELPAQYDFRMHPNMPI